MQAYMITKPNKQILYSTKAKNMKQCLEDAIEKNIDLQGADLSFKDLSNTNLDGAQLKNASFDGANLSGTNLSEATLDGATFQNTDLYNACLSESSLRGCDFQTANFGGTLIDNADISGSLFSTLSCFSLDFSSTRAMQGCHFQAIGHRIAMSYPPRVIYGISPKPYVAFDTQTCHGHSIIRQDELSHALAKIHLETGKTKNHV